MSSACSAIFSAKGDEAVDASADAAAECAGWSYAPLFFDPCDLNFQEPPAFSQDLALIVDTTDLEVRDSNDVLVAELGEVTVDGKQVALWSLSDFAFEGSMQLVGIRSLLIVVDGDANLVGSISGTADELDQGRPAGSRNATTCGTSAGGIGTNESGGGSGGGGGGYGGAGAKAGISDSDNKNIPGGMAGLAQSLPIGIRGGCGGGFGGSGNPPLNNAKGGYGGGAFHLTVRDTLGVPGSVTMGGTGGAGARTATSAGGGGGGSGGYIGFEASNVQVSGILSANGGGGGGGSSIPDGDGEPGQAGHIGITAANGGLAGGGNASDGGSGGALATLALESDSPLGGSGGGGGGVGHIRIRASVSTLGEFISPLPVESTP